MADPLDSALDLMRRMPPENVESHLAALIDIVPDLTDDLLAAVDQPLKVMRCQRSGRDFLLCDYNRDADSYRSPWSNEYSPPLPDGGAMPSPSLRKIEVAANDAFDTYRDLYFEGGISSVYLWDLDEGFAAVILIKKVGDKASSKIEGSWDSIHVLEIHEHNRTAHYKLTSTIMLYMLTNQPNAGTVNLSGSMTRQMEQDMALDPPNDLVAAHVANMGRMVEEMEIKMRNNLQEIYFGKTKDIVNDLRSIMSLNEKSKQADVQRELASRLQEKSK